VLRLSGEDTATAEQMQAMMERQIAYLTRLVDDLLDVSRISRGIIDLRKEPMELVAVIHSAIENSKPFITAAHHRLDVALPVEPLYLEGDPVRLEQIVINLLNNAAKFTEKGGQIDFTVRREEEYAIVSVRDNGIGIDADFLPQIFEMFIQEDRSVKRTQSGLGIGLALVKILAKLHGGSVEAHSEGPGKGAEFIVRLPLAPAHLAETARGACLAATSLAGLRVLVVDDNRDAADSLGMLLSRLDAEVQVVHDGPAALALLASYQPSVVLLDIGMPEMDGYEVAWRIREKFPKYGGITLVALTGWGRDEDRQRTSAAGFDHHLTKPVDIQALQALLANAKSVS
jgi:CheY-like chemotaxis protein